ncbi:N/A [soil metagenome]
MLFTGACATSPSVAPGAPAAAATAHRVYDVAAGRYIGFDELVARAADADVVFFGEQHGLQPGHRLQFGLLQGLAAGGADAALSMEMFERDVAPLVESYAAGTASLDELLADARPWPRFANDYQPQVDLTRTQGWPVIAANVPRELASLVAREGLTALGSLDTGKRAHAAEDIRCPDDAYRTRFVEEIRRHPMGPPGTPEEDAAREQRYYESQCVKDETMAESIVRALRAAAAPRPIVHLTGAFHSDHGDGIPARVLRRVPGADIITLTVVSVENLRRADPTAHAARADYLLFVVH